MSIERVPFDDPDGARLRAELEAEHEALYGEGSEPGPKPTAADVTVFLLARDDDDGTAVGCGGLREAGPSAVELKRMFVSPEARRRGIGRLLLRALEDEAVALGARRVVLESGDAQRAAVELYERSGYRRVPCVEGHTRSVCLERAL